MDKEAAVEYVRRHYRSLLEEGEFRFRPPPRGAAHTAGWVIDLVSKAFCVRFVLDRGQVFVEVETGPEAGNWHDLGIIISFLTNGECLFEYSMPEGPITDEEIERQIARGAEAIRHNYAMIASFFLPDGFEDRESGLVAFRRERSEQRWKRLLR